MTTYSATHNLNGAKFILDAQTPVGNDLALGYNIGYNNFGSGSGDLTYSIALGIPVSDKVGVYIEPYGDLVEMEELDAKFDAGMTYLANDNLQFDFSFGTGISNRSNYISLGFSWRSSK